MIDTNSIAIGLAGGIGVLVVGKIILKGLGVNGRRSNPNSKFTKEMHDTLCTSRLETVRTEIKGMGTNIHTKLDFITENIKEMKKNNESRRREFRL